MLPMRGWSHRIDLRCAVLFALLVLVPVTRLEALDTAKFLEAARTRGQHTVLEAQAMLQMIEGAVLQDEPARLVTVNDFFNKRIAFHTDWEVWGVEDYWATPLEALWKGAGDCEDYAIAKYFSLIAAGVPESKLRMVYVQVMLEGRSQAHMVVAYYGAPDDMPKILDNIDFRVLPAAQRPDLTPKFSFNTVGVWNGVGMASMGNPMARLSKWSDLVAKVRMEGF